MRAPWLTGSALTTPYGPGSRYTPKGALPGPPDKAGPGMMVPRISRVSLLFIGAGPGPIGEKAEVGDDEVERLAY